MLVGLMTVLPLALEPAETLTLPFMTKEGSVLAGGQGADAGTHAIVAQGGAASYRYPAFGIGVAHVHVAEHKHIILIG